jgi:pyruvate kinase
MLSMVVAAMLNKGPFILEAVKVLDCVLTRMAPHHHKKTATLRALHAWDHIAAKESLLVISRFTEKAHLPR